MSSADLIRWGALGHVLAGVAWVVSGLISLVIPGQGTEEIGSSTYYLLETIVCIASVGMLGGLAGLHASQAASYGQSGAADVHLPLPALERGHGGRRRVVHVQPGSQAPLSPRRAARGPRRSPAPRPPRGGTGCRGHSRTRSASRPPGLPTVFLHVAHLTGVDPDPPRSVHEELGVLSSWTSRPSGRVRNATLWATMRASGAPRRSARVPSTLRLEVAACSRSPAAAAPALSKAVSCWTTASGRAWRTAAARASPSSASTTTSSAQRVRRSSALPLLRVVPTTS